MVILLDAVGIEYHECREVSFFALDVFSHIRPVTFRNHGRSN